LQERVTPLLNLLGQLTLGRILQVLTLGGIVTPQPVCVLEPAGAVSLTEQLIADQTGGALEVPQLAPETAGGLDAGTAWCALRGDLLEDLLPIQVAGVGGVGSEDRDGLSVLHGHDGTGSEVLQWWVCGIADEDHAAVVQLQQRLTVGHLPPVVGPQGVQTVLDELGAVGIGLLELLRVTPVLWDITGLTALQVTLGLEDSHLVEQLATTQRVLDEVHMRSDVTDDGLEILHGLILLQLGGATVGHVGGRDRLILNELRAMAGVDAVERQEGISVEGGRALLALPLQIDLNAGLGTTGLTNSGTVVQGGTGLTSSIHKDGQLIRAVDDQVAATVVLLELLVEAQG